MRCSTVSRTPRDLAENVTPVGAVLARDKNTALFEYCGALIAGKHRSHKAFAAMIAGCLMVIAPAFAAPLPELALVSEHLVDGMVGGNLSGLAVCSGQLWAVSDRDDNLLYRMDMTQTVWQALPNTIDVPPAPESDLPASLRSLAKLSSYVRGGSLDLEGISCDASGNKYVVSEAHAQVLKVPVEGAPVWLKLPVQMVAQAREKGMLQHFNAIFEGVAVSSQGNRLWLAAERDQRGLLMVSLDKEAWRCKTSCVLRTEPGKEVLPVQIGGKTVQRDFADLSLFNGKLFTLERSAYRICRRSPDTGKSERCWSFAKDALVPNRIYDQPFALTEALAVDESGAWIGIDNNFDKRADGETRPIVWRFAAPPGGWSAP